MGHGVTVVSVVRTRVIYTLWECHAYRTVLQNSACILSILRNLFVQECVRELGCQQLGHRYLSLNVTFLDLILVIW